jgi:hypothetical protein
MKRTSDFVTATVLEQLEHLALDVSRDTADEVSLAMVRGCVRSLRGRKRPLSKLIELIVDEAWRDQLH